MKMTLLALGAVSALALASPALAAGGATPAQPTAMHTPTNTASSHSASTPRAPSILAQAQAKLKADNLYNGPINGRRTDATVIALRAFQTQHHLTQTGRLDAPTRQALGV